MPPATPPPTLPTLRIGTRASRLALAQTEIAAATLKRAGFAVAIVAVKTSGDRIRNKPLADFGGKALFAKELEEALLEGEIDLAVHSLKDLPASLPAGLRLSAVLPRAIAFDTLVLPTGAAGLACAPRVGTGSVRRGAQVRRAFPGATVLPLRGNVDTRLKMLDGGGFDALILSAAGLERLGRPQRIGTLLRGKGWLPALGQGAIGIESRDGDDRIDAIVASLDDFPSHLCVAAERAFQTGLEGNCHSPIAGLARIEAGALQFQGEVLAPDGSAAVGTTFAVALSDAGEADLAAVCARALAAGRTLRPQAMRWL
jgi:hydroxymethylbilane synthase